MNKIKQEKRLLDLPQYTISTGEKADLLGIELLALTERHRARCPEYSDIYDSIYASKNDPSPPLPVRLFKTLKLQSVPESEVIKTLKSSGTTTGLASQVFLDKETAVLQTKALVSIVTSFIGSKRLPMIIVDSPHVLKERSTLSARAAGILGLSNFGRDHFYALDEDMKLDIDGLHNFLEKHREEEIIIFGFTYMIWKYMHEVLRRSRDDILLDKAVLIHSGGWKKMKEQAVSNEEFKKVMLEDYGIKRIHNFYGMAEQVGSIYMECEHGYLHAPNYADVYVRDFNGWEVLPAGEQGVIQTVSILPRSYPGHSILTEDIGTIHGSDDCACGRKGTYFTVEGRIPMAELRGCSDTFNMSRDNSSAVNVYLPEIQSSGSIENIVNREILEERADKPFGDAMGFLSEVSKRILKNKGIKEFPEIVALAYWLRKANLEKIRNEFLGSLGSAEIAASRGLAFHVAPANVDSIFMYSWALSMMAGNKNIIRISQKRSQQLEIILNNIREVFSDPAWRGLAKRNLVISYPHDEDINKYISGKADARIIWGGDDTVQTLRSLKTKPGTNDVVFADKVSYAVIKSETFYKEPEENVKSLAYDFYNDAYQFGQMACSSPKVVFFAGSKEECTIASKEFWGALATAVQENYEPDMTDENNKLVFSHELAANGTKMNIADEYWKPAMTVVRIPIDEVSKCRLSFGGGYFIECFIENLESLLEIIRPNDQTLSYIGYTKKEMLKAAPDLSSRGIKRIVPVGSALDFMPVWDGYVVLAELTQRIKVT